MTAFTFNGVNVSIFENTKKMKIPKKHLKCCCSID
jgi:hypothetical protein